MFVCDGLQHGRIRQREENRKEFNCTHVSEAETINNKRLRSHFVLKLYRHEAPRGLFATAELLVHLIVVSTNVDQFL